MSARTFACALVLWMPVHFTHAQESDVARQPGDWNRHSDSGTPPSGYRWGSSESTSQTGLADYAPNELPNQSSQAGPRPIVTRQRSFSIPFTLSSTQDRDQPAEVRLYVSGDQGANWSLYQRETPAADRFRFRAARDGEFWFMVKTVGSSDEPIDVRNQQPELIVVVDTAQPRVEFAAVAGEDGGVQVEWKATDPNLAAHSFRLEYRASPDADWQQVEVDLPTPEDWRQEITGKADWWLKSNPSEVEVRAEVLDRAGNSSIVNKTVALHRIAADTRASVAAIASSGAQPQDGPRSIDVPRTSDSSSSSRDWWRRGPKQDRTAGAPEEKPSWSPFNTVSEVDRQPAGSGNDSALQSPPQDGFAATRDLPTQGATLDRSHVGTAPIDEPESRPWQSEIAPPVANRYQPEPVVPRPNAAPRMSTSPRFQLDYDLLDVGPRGVTRVELWSTMDQGRTWQLYDHDPDNRSPFDVQVQREGLYGFCMVVYSDGAAAPRPPQDGDTADLWVGVDWTKPVAKITSARHIGSERRTLVEIQWQASDAWLGERPIAISFSEQPGGPWSTIESGLPNSGRYEWQIDRKPPSNLYLRLEVRDQAGNTTVHELDQPVVDETRTPKGRIRDLRPINEVTVRPVR